MQVIKSITLLCVMIPLTLCAIENNKKSIKPCTSKEACLNDPNCLCWCSQVCSWRKKTPADHPVYIENDPYGKFCYCKQWDYDHYEDNCIYGKNVKQPPGAK